MANNYDDYNELLKKFEAKSTEPVSRSDNATNSSSQNTRRPVNSARRPASDKNRTENSSPSTPRYSAPPVNSQEKNSTYKGGVYFSNPPRDIDKEAERQKRAATGRGAAIRRNISADNKKVNKKKSNTKSAQGNKFQRFLSSERFKRAMVLLAIIVVVSTVLCFYGIRCINDVVALNVEDKSVEVTVQAGMTDKDVLKILKKNDLINNRIFCQLFLSVFEQDGEYISGVYTLTPSMGVEKMIATMKTDFKNSETVSLTFPEGYTIDQIAEKLEANEVCTASSFISTLQNVDFSSEYDFIEAIPDKEKRFRVLEGYIYPDTYEFYVGENASSVVRRFLNNFDNRWTEEYQAKADAMGLTVDEVIIMASILQKEAANSGQMPTIASVLYNRLDRPNAFPLLQCDSTEDYLLEVIKPTLTSSAEDTQKYIEYRDDYDTYSEECVGLPIGAIANPGDAAINAALNPDDTSYLYFRHDSKGEVYYASSFAEHQQNGRKVANADS